ncbi:MAG: hypothetical protein ACRENI_00020 [Gemmatimonadaceae bacterium]
MNPGLIALLIGAFVVPTALLWGGHRLRRRPLGWRGAFLGALIAYVAAALVAMAAAMFPPQQWSDGDLWRGLLGFWTPAVLPVVGALVGAALAGRRSRAARP